MGEVLDRFRDRALILKLAKLIKGLAKGLDKIRIMHVCGTHEHTITHYGLRHLMPPNVKLIAGPGCPVCIVPAREVDEAVKLALSGVTVYTYGDMYKVPGSKMSLAQARAKGGKVKVVYGFDDVLRKRVKEDSVFFAVGFETTAPTVASPLYEGRVPEVIKLLTSYRLTVPVLRYVLSLKASPIRGVICPGHVSAITGASAWEYVVKDFKIPAVIAGFEPLDVMIAVTEILKQLREGKARLVNEYSRVVSYEGNLRAKQYLKEVFEVVDGKWRGIGLVPLSKLKLKDEFSTWDARLYFEDKLRDIGEGDDIKPGCKCAEVILGIMEPKDCPMFMRACTPSKPLGPCMVSSEGTCHIWAKYGYLG
ncbi:MAG: hydrogenase formation protein HypD [Thermofilum sp. ex4484_15]|nr:MAG: hydrogenase formation protein HypD [Thermofilum sp. ex4484_15]